MSNNVLEFFVKMRDMMSGGLSRLAQNSQRTFQQVQGNIDRTATRNNELARSFDNVSTRARSSENSIGQWVKRLSLAAAGAAALSFGTSSINKAMEFGKTKESFKVLVGSDQKGEGLANDLNKLQQNTILGPEVFKAAQTMLGFGIQSQKVLPTLKMLGDISMGDAQKMESLTLAFSQVSSAGKLQGQDLLQMINAGFNPLNEISKKTGISIGELKKQMEKGAISAKMVEDSLVSATGKGGAFNGMMEKLADTPAGKMAQLQGQFESLQVKIGETLMPVANVFMTVAGFLMDHIDIVMAVATAWGVYQVAVNAAAIKQFWLNTVMKMNPLMLVISLIAGLIIWINSLVQKYGGWGKALSSLWTIIKGFGTLAGLVFMELGQNIWYWMEFAWLKVKGFFEWIGGALSNVMKALSLVAEFKFGAAKEALFAEIKTKASTEIEELEKKHKAQQLSNQAAKDAAVKQMAAGWTNLTTKPGESKKSSVSVTDAGKAAAPGAGASSFNSLKGESGDVAKGIASGGPRVINITIGKMVEKIEMHVAEGKDALQGLEHKVEEVFLRVLNSGAAIQ